MLSSHRTLLNNSFLWWRHLLINSDFLLSKLLSPRLFNIKYFSVKQKSVSVYFSDNAPFDGWNFVRTCNIPDIFRQFSVIFVLLMYKRSLVVTISPLKWYFCQAIIKLSFIIIVVWNIGAVNNLWGQTLVFHWATVPVSAITTIALYFWF